MFPPWEELSGRETALNTEASRKQSFGAEVKKPRELGGGSSCVTGVCAHASFYFFAAVLQELHFPLSFFSTRGRALLRSLRHALSTSASLVAPSPWRAFCSRIFLM